MSSLPSGIMRRFSRSSSVRKNQNQQNQQPQSSTGPQSPTSYTYPPNLSAGPTRDQALGGAYTVVPNDGRPISSATDASFDFSGRPVSGTGTTTNASTAPGSMTTRPGGGATTSSMRTSSQRYSQGAPTGGLSRTDQIVLQHFWEGKYREDTRRDLHYLKFPYFPSFPTHKDLLPYCEVYHLVKTSPGATIISLGSADGVYIGFELSTGSQLHIDLDDDWFTNASNTSITHHRVTFRPYSSLIADPDAPAVFKTWPKPLTIEFLEDQYQAWCRDLLSICWESSEVRELGGGGNGNGDGGMGTGMGGNNGGGGAGVGTGRVGGEGMGGREQGVGLKQQQQQQSVAQTSGSVRNRNSAGSGVGTGAVGRNSAGAGLGNTVAAGAGMAPQHTTSQGSMDDRHAAEVVDDGYGSERSNDPGV